MIKRFPIRAAVAVLFVAGLSSPAAAQNRSPAAPPAAAPRPPPTAVTSAADPEMPRALLVPERETTLVAQMVGVVQKLGGTLGSGFRQGTALVRFDCAEQRARMGMARAELNSADQQHQAKLRLQALSAAGEVEVSLAAAALARAQAQIDLSNSQLTPCTVNAPFTGRVAKIHVREYQGVNVGQPLMDIVSAGPLRVRLNAPSKWLAWLRKGAAFEVQIDETAKSYPARVTAINSRVDAVSQTVEVEGEISREFAELLAGMSGNARFAPPAR